MLSASWRSAEARGGAGRGRRVNGGGTGERPPAPPSSAALHKPKSPFRSGASVDTPMPRLRMCTPCRCKKPHLDSTKVSLHGGGEHLSTTLLAGRPPPHPVAAATGTV